MSIQKPKLIYKDQLEHISPNLNHKYKYGIVYFDGQFNDTKMALETVLTAMSITQNKVFINLFRKNVWLLIIVLLLGF